MREVPPDAPDADVQEQSQDWTEQEQEENREIPPDAPEADVLDQGRSAGLDDEEWETR